MAGVLSILGQLGSISPQVLPIPAQIWSTPAFIWPKLAELDWRNLVDHFLVDQLWSLSDKYEQCVAPKKLAFRAQRISLYRRCSSGSYSVSRPRQRHCHASRAGQHDPAGGASTTPFLALVCRSTERAHELATSAVKDNRVLAGEPKLCKHMGRFCQVDARCPPSDLSRLCDSNFHTSRSLWWLLRGATGTETSAS